MPTSQKLNYKTVMILLLTVAGFGAILRYEIQMYNSSVQTSEIYRASRATDVTGNVRL